MKTAYSEEMRPPKELFSRQWYHKDGFEITTIDPRREDIYYRVDSLRSKLEKLESALKEVGDMKDILYKVEWIRVNIGVWSTIKHRGECNNALLIYPKKKRSTGGWNESMFGKEKKEGKYLVMASPECVEWLNEVSKLVGVSV